MNEEILKPARALADDIFRPGAEKADLGDIHGQVGANIRLLAEARFFGLGIAKAYGGLEADEATRREYTEIMASACGVTAFVQQQLHAGGNFVGNARYDSLKREMLPKFASGEVLCGVAFSHLRRPGSPLVHAERVNGGYLINGVAPWVTGWSLLDAFILGAAMPNGDHLFAYVPKEGNAHSLENGSPIPLAVMNAGDTVEVRCTDLFVPEEYALYERPADALRRSDFCGITGGVYLPLGCARGSVHALRALGEKRRKDTFTDAADELMREIEIVRGEALQWSGACADLPDYKDHALHARAGAIALAVRAAHAVVTATGGAAHLLSNPAQRLMREAMFYTTTAQTPDIQEGTLELLVSPECWDA